MVLNPGDVERYDTKVHKTFGEFIQEGVFTSTNNIFTFEVTDKCLKS